MPAWRLPPLLPCTTLVAVGCSAVALAVAVATGLQPADESSWPKHPPGCTERGRHQMSTDQVNQQQTTAQGPAQETTRGAADRHGQADGSSSASSSATSALPSPPATWSSASGSGSTARWPSGPADARSWPSATGTDPRYVEEWLRGQAAGGYVEYDAATATYSLTPEQAFALTDPDGPVFLPGAFELALGALRAEPQHRGGVPHRDGLRLARARHRGVHRVRAVLPSRLPERLLPRVDPGPGRRRRRSSSAAPRSPTSAAATAPRRC